MEYVEQKHWDTAYEDKTFEPAGEDNILRKWILRFVPRGNGSCLEIGCYPGTYLTVFGDLGYQLHGIDLTHNLDELPRWLETCGYDAGEFLQIDFQEYKPSSKYDVVCSFGFIEHFQDWSSVLIKQASLVRQGGYLVVSTPNFRGIVQRALHIAVDRENYSRHNVNSMNPAMWKRAVREMGFEVLHSGYIGPFGFWNEEQRRNSVQNQTLYYIYRLMPHLQKVLPENKQPYSPFCGLIARKI